VTGTDEVRRERAAVAALAFAVAAPVAYVAQRLVAYARGASVDPLAMIQEAHVAFYWRCAISAWLAGFAALVAWWLTARARPSDRGLHRTALAVPAVGALVALLSWLFP